MRVLLMFAMLSVLGQLSIAHGSEVKDALLPFQGIHTLEQAKKAFFRNPSLVGEPEKEILSLPYDIKGKQTPRSDLREKAAQALEKVLTLHGLVGRLTTFVYSGDVPDLFIWRSRVIVISAGAVGILSQPSLIAFFAHELGHLYFDAEFAKVSAPDIWKTRRKLEYICDGVSMVTLLAMQLEPNHLIVGLKDVDRAVKRLNYTLASSKSHPTTSQRREFVDKLYKKLTK